MIDIAPPRSVMEWVGKSPDQPFPDRVRTRIYLRDKGTCQICKRKLAAGDKWIADHKIAIINGGQNRESNGQLICDWCDKHVKTPADVKEKSNTARVRAKHIGARRATSRPIPGSRASGIRKRMNGTVERW